MYICISTVSFLIIKKTIFFLHTKNWKKFNSIRFNFFFNISFNCLYNNVYKYLYLCYNSS